MDWTDRHCRLFDRLVSRRTRLSTEMVTTGALLHGDVPRHLDFDAAEHPVALQLGGSEPADVAACAKLAERWGYDDVNLNCGCPSERVQRGAWDDGADARQGASFAGARCAGLRASAWPHGAGRCRSSEAPRAWPPRQPAQRRSPHPPAGRPERITGARAGAR